MASGYANESTVSNYLRSKSLGDQKQENTYKFLTEISLIFEGVDFPRIESEFNYFKILEKIGSILFKNCEFWQCDEVLTKRENQQRPVKS